MSHLTSKQMKYLATHPHAFHKFQATGRAPAMVTPASPLITLLETIPPGLRAQIRGVQLHPKLGYQTGRQFHTAEQLYRWLKPSPQMLEGESWPAESYRIKRFSQRLELADLKAQASSWPPKEVLFRSGLRDPE